MLLLQPVFTDAVPQATWDAVCVGVFQIIAMEASGACREIRFSREEMTSFFLLSRVVIRAIDGSLGELGCAPRASPRCERRALAVERNRFFMWLC